jgi:hypothetical protein
MFVLGLCQRSLRSVAPLAVTTASTASMLMLSQSFRSSASSWPPGRAAAACRTSPVTATATPLAGERSRRAHRLRSASAAFQAGHTTHARARASTGRRASTLCSSASGSEEIVVRGRAVSMPPLQGCARASHS